MNHRDSPASPLKVLHVVPDSVFSEAHRFSGGAKGIRIFREYMEDRGIPYDEIGVPNRSDAWLLGELGKRDLRGYTTVFLHYPVYVRSLRYLKLACPWLRTLVRSHNAEFPHWLQHAWLWLLQGNVRKSVKAFLVAFQKGWGDLRSAKLADHILAVTDWERDHYWARFADRSRVAYVPYFIPRDSAPPGGRPEGMRKDQVVCMMSSGASSFLVDGAQRFGALAEVSKSSAPGWRFLITGRESAVPASIPASVERTGFVDDPLALLYESRAVALLTDYGFGFKTKILEAAACGCWSLVTPLVFDRLPVDVRPYCVVVENKSAEAFAAALENTRMPLPEGNLDILLRTQAYAVMDRLMGVKG